MAIGEALGSIVGGFLGKNAAKSDLKNQKKLMQQAISEYTKLGYPPDYSKALVLQEYERAGVLTPELEQEVEIAASEMGQVQADPATVEAMRRVAAQYSNLSQTGLGAEDRAAANQINSELNQSLKANRESGLQRAQMMGQGGSGATLMALLSGDQDATNKASQDAAALAANASSARRDALQRYGQISGEMRNASFNEKSTAAQALDERNRMLAQNSVARQSTNVANINKTNESNVNREQYVSDKNTATNISEAQRQAQAQADRYAQQLQFTAGKTGQIRDMADFRGQQAQQKFNQSVAMGKGIGGLADSGLKEAGGMAGVAAMFSDANLKNDIDYSDDEVISWMDRIAKRLKAPKE